MPSLLSFEMQLDYPSYTQKKDETLKSTGNATIPEGTKITWKLNTKQTEEVKLELSDTVFVFQKNIPEFLLTKSVFSNLEYRLTTSNKQLKDYESLAFSISVIKDQYPEISVEGKQDTLNSQWVYFMGKVSDDYGLSRLQIVYYPEGDENSKQTELIPLNPGTFDQFLYAFPGELPLEEGKEYSYYFEVFDNDGVNGAKSAKSSVYSYRKLTQSELEKQQLQEQKENIQGLDKSLQQMNEQKKQLDELSRMRIEKRPQLE